MKCAGTLSQILRAGISNPPMFNGMDDALKRTLETYRRDLWATQPHYVEVWAEKDAIAGMIDDVTDRIWCSAFCMQRVSPVSPAMYFAI